MKLTITLFEFQIASNINSWILIFVLIFTSSYSIDRLGQSTITVGSDHCFPTCCPSVHTFQNLANQNNFQVKTIFTTGGTVGLVEWIINWHLSCLCWFVLNMVRVQSGPPSTLPPNIPLPPPSAPSSQGTADTDLSSADDASFVILEQSFPKNEDECSSATELPKDFSLEAFVSGQFSLDLDNEYMQRAMRMMVQENIQVCLIQISNAV